MKRSSSARPVASASRAVLGGRRPLRHAGIGLPRVGGRQVEEVPAPRGQRDVQPVAEIVAAPLVCPAVGRVLEPPGPAAQVVPRERDVPSAGPSPRLTTTSLRDVPRQPQPTRLPPALVAVPAAALGTHPLALPEDGVAERTRGAARRTPQVRVDRLVGPTAQEDRQLHRPALELALVDEPRAGLAQRRHRGCAGLRLGNVAAARGSSWFSTKRTSRCWYSTSAPRWPCTCSAPSWTRRS